MQFLRYAKSNSIFYNRFMAFDEKHSSSMSTFAAIRDTTTFPQAFLLSSSSRKKQWGYLVLRELSNFLFSRFETLLRLPEHEQAYTAIAIILD